ncbi:MAG: Zn-ribbon domain-containing OB-fold protein [Anaerolineae bacterium]
METGKPVPPIDPWAAPFWDAARQDRLLIQRCHDCERAIFYPRLYCPFCFSERLDWVEASGRATVYSFSVVRSNAPSAFIGDMPFVIAIVRLEEGVQMMTNIVGCDPDEVHCDMPVMATFDRLTDEITLVKFKPRMD